MNENSITRMTLEELRAKRARGEKSQTDWDRVNAMTDEEIEEEIKDDPDWEEWKDVDWSKAVWVTPRVKRAISIRLDEDIIDFFKKEGPGYQSRINAVLRYYMENSRKAAE
jgi:uncharacterized protein (DUF4415 family)